ncbi:triple gene block protein 1 [Kudzu virus D]|nr:triple gene block protein 1 [Kudzu virus D]
MNNIIELFEKSGFVKISDKNNPPYFLHAVPGAGKTSLLKDLLQENRQVRVYSKICIEKPNLSGRYIKLYRDEVLDESFINILDEYAFGSFVEGFDFYLGDPLQLSLDLTREADFIKSTSYRVPKPVCEFLCAAGHLISGVTEGSISFETFFGEEPSGTILAYQKEVLDYLRSYNLAVLSPCEVQGREFDLVTLFVAGILSEEAQCKEFYCCATRAKSKLIIRSTDESAPSK